MTAELLAIISAFFLAAAGVTIRFGLTRKTSPFTAFITFGAGAVFVWLIVLIMGYELPNRTGMVFFALRGILDPGISALIIFIVLRKVGVVITATIMATHPLISSFLAIIFLNESITLFIALGTVVIILGVILLNFTHTKNMARLKYVLMAFTGAILVGTSVVVTKFALNNSNTPVSGLAISFTVGVLFHAIIIIILRKWNTLRMSWNDSKWFILAGVFVFVGFLFGFNALSQGKAIIVAPLAGTAPLFTLLLSRLLLKKYETITKSIVIGTVFVVIGAAILALV